MAKGNGGIKTATMPTGNRTAANYNPASELFTIPEYGEVSMLNIMVWPTATKDIYINRAQERIKELDEAIAKSKRDIEWYENAIASGNYDRDILIYREYIRDEKANIENYQKTKADWERVRDNMQWAKRQDRQ